MIGKTKIRLMQKRVQTESVSLPLLKEYDIDISDLEMSVVDMLREHGHMKVDNERAIKNRVGELMAGGVKAKSHAELMAEGELSEDIDRVKHMAVDINADKLELSSHTRTFHLGKVELRNAIEATGNIKDLSFLEDLQ